jgi:Fe-S cluster assembly protein SufD
MSAQAIGDASPFAAAHDAAREPISLRPLREAAWQRYLARPSPQGDANWRYTDVAAFVGPWQPASATDASAPAWASADAVLENGRIMHRGKAEGVTFTKLGKGPVTEIDSPFAELNLACFPEALVVEVTGNAGTIHVVNATSGDGASHPRIIIRVARGASATLVEEQTGKGTGWSNAVTEVRLANDGRLNYVRLQDAAESCLMMAHADVELERGARLAMWDLAVGAMRGRLGLVVRLGEGAEVQLDGLMLAKGEQRLDAYTRIEHVQPHATSRERYKGIFAGASRGGFIGNIYVAPGAQGTASEQENRNLLLSRQALAEATPQLGQLDDDALFFLQSRGIPQERARAMLIQAFAGDVLAGVPVAWVKERLEATVAQWMEDA